tara:strand:+ start:6574 stop:7362 length:789 start_codon:yes stop_codon:yes gene_type:complete
LNNKTISKKIRKLRLEFLKLLLEGYKFHIGGTLSCLDLMTVLFYNNYINLNKKNRDYFILSKGHALANFLLILIDKKLISKKNIKNLYTKNKLGNQLDCFNLKFVDWNTGSLGHSVGVSTGLSLANPNKKIWNIIGDAEFDEGSIWEALFYISEKKIKNIILIVDRNKMSASSFIDFKEFFDKKIINKLNINKYVINGHNIGQINSIFKMAKNSKKSSVIIANTVKGNGIKEFENSLSFSHGMPEKKMLEMVYYKYKKIYNE